MKLFPRYGYRLAGFQIFNSPRHLLIPGFLDRLIGSVKTVEQRVSQSGAFLTGERKRAFQEIGNIGTHRSILHCGANPLLTKCASHNSLRSI